MGVKNLFFKDSEKHFYHIIAAYTTRVELKKTGNVLDAKDLHFADAELLKQYLGVEPGSVRPLALINGKEYVVQVIVDADIFDQEYIQMHPLKNDATVVITSKDLIKFFELINRSYLVYDFANNQIVQ